ncbi:MAG TPA: hypothetical protein DCE23_07335 [Firmicutes bacterium]|nr:hypothetical protein [Bacillota bacterium]
MEKKTIDNQQQYYIVTLDNGIHKEEPVSITVYNSFSDGSHLVQLNQTVFGVFKSNSTNPDTSYIDDYDIIKSDIAELFDIDHEESHRIVTESSNVGIFTNLNYSKDIETRISATTVINHIVEYINKGIIVGEEAEWLTKVLQYPTGTKGNGIKDSQVIDDIIRLGSYSLVKEIEIQTGVQIDPAVKRAIEKKYIRMILFDYIIGRKYRGLDYYIISRINEHKKPIWIDGYLSPISISNPAAKDELVADNEYVLNNKLIDRNALLQVLFSKYYREIRKLTTAITEAKKLYIDAICRIAYNNTELLSASTLEEVITKNLETVAKLETETEKKLDKELKTNKVERTMATQSLNVRVTTKLDLIQKKYPINPKDHPELRDKVKEAKTREDINLIIEEKKSVAGFTTTSILIAAVSLICGIGIGIAYILLTFGS